MIRQHEAKLYAAPEGRIGNERIHFVSSVGTAWVALMIPALTCTAFNGIVLLISLPASKDFLCHRHQAVRLESEFILELLQRR
jgi:hypothetical protein